MTEPTGDPTVLTDNPQPTTQVDWKESVPEDYRENVSKFNDVGSLAKSYVELERQFGNRVKIPDENSMPEEVSAFYQKLGRPENKDAYDLGLSEDTPVNTAILDAIKTTAFENGVSQTQLQGMVKSYMEAEQAELHRSFEEGERTMKETWGAKYDENLAIAKRATKELFDEDFIKILDGSPLGNSPIVIRNLHNIGLKMLDDTLVTGKAEGKEGEFTPPYPNSPEMYKDDDTEEGKKARAYFERKGHKY
jgi:hypothetical protein